jgi:aryl-alcohol dehydrogenase-like predicted oxidoreductase
VGGLQLQLISDVSQDETSEEFIGEWVEKRGIQDQLVIATKASTDFPRVARLFSNIIISTRPTSRGVRIKSLTR